MLEHLIKTFIVFFVVVEPISLVPMFGALTRGADARSRRRMAIKGVVLSAIIFYGLVIVGDWLQSFREFPPRQKPGSFNLERVMEAVMEVSPGGR